MMVSAEPAVAKQGAAEVGEDLEVLGLAARPGRGPDPPVPTKPLRRLHASAGNPHGDIGAADLGPQRTHVIASSACSLAYR